jgi:uncharacterized membrane protein
MASAQLTDAKILGGSGSILMILLPIPYAGLALYIAGVVLVIIAVRRIASALGDQKIFNYALVSVILIVVGLAAGVAVVVLTGLASIIQLLNITPTPDGIIIVQNEWDGGLRTWMIPSVATLRWLIYEATAGETPPRIYHPPPLNSIVLERVQVERFHIVARPYEVKADEC